MIYHFIVKPIGRLIDELKKSFVAALITHNNYNNLELTPELIVICAALGLSTAVAHLTAVLFIVYAKTEVFPLEHTQEEHNMNHTGYKTIHTD